MLLLSYCRVWFIVNLLRYDAFHHFGDSDMLITFDQSNILDYGHQYVKELESKILDYGHQYVKELESLIFFLVYYQICRLYTDLLCY